MSENSGLDVRELNYSPEKFYVDFRNNITLDLEMKHYVIASEEYLYFYDFCKQYLTAQNLNNSKALNIFGKNHKSILADWYKYATPKGARLYKVSRLLDNTLPMTHISGHSIFNAFVPIPTDSLFWSENGVEVANLGFLKDLLLTEINQKTNHLDLQIIEFRRKFLFKLRIGKLNKSDLTANLLDMDSLSVAKVKGTLPYEDLAVLEPTKHVLTRNSKKLISNLLQAFENCQGKFRFDLFPVKQKQFALKVRLAEFQEQVFDADLEELFDYFKTLYNSGNYTPKELDLISSLSKKTSLLFTQKFQSLISEYHKYVRLHTTIMSLYVISAVNNNTGLTSDSTLDSIPQDIIDFSVKHIDEIVVELINYVNGLEKYGYIVTD